jgi:hypothetical protein
MTHTKITKRLAQPLILVCAAALIFAIPMVASAADKTKPAPDASARHYQRPGTSFSQPLICASKGLLHLLNENFKLPATSRG